MPMPGGEIRPATEAVLTTWPSPCATRRGTKARTPWITPHRLTPSAHCQSPEVFCQRGPSGETPALLQTTWTSFREAAQASTSPAFETSTRMVLAFFARRAVSSRPFSSTSASARLMPSFAKASAMARPRPLAAPVMAAVLPCRVFILSPRIDDQRCAADQDQRLHEQHVQVRVHARNQPGGDRAAGNRRGADHQAGKEGIRVQQREAVEERRLAKVEHDADQRVGG